MHTIKEQKYHIYSPCLAIKYAKLKSERDIDLHNKRRIQENLNHKKSTKKQKVQVNMLLQTIAHRVLKLSRAWPTKPNPEKTSKKKK